MSKESISTLLQAKGSFPDAADVRANVDALLAMASQGSERTADLAWGFMQTLDQWSHVDAVLDTTIAQRLRHWALAQWPAAPYDAREQLGRVLLNVATPQTLAFLTEQRAQATDPDLQALLDSLLAQHPGA